MAYKINGNTIIDDGGNVTFANFPSVGKPSNLEPIEGSDVYGFVELVMSDYSGFYEGTIPKKSSQFQVANINTFADGNIVYDSGNIADAPNSNLTISLTASETYYWRGRYSNNNDVYSEFSDPTSFVYAGVNVPPDGIGCTYQGGFFFGNVEVSGICYYLILSPNSSGCSCQDWKNAMTLTPGVNNSPSGYELTYPTLADSLYPAGNFTATRTIGGYTDWYMPGTSESSLMFSTRGSMPAGEGYCQVSYWNSRKNGACSGYAQSFATGNFNTIYYTCRNRVRAIRRAQH